MQTTCQKFDIAEYVARHSRDPAPRQAHTSPRPVLPQAGDRSARAGFEEIVRRVAAHFDSMFDTNDTRKSQEWLDYQHNAIIGVPRAVRFFKDEITEYLRRHNLLNAGYPKHYHSLTHAVYHELYGLGPLAVWYDHPSSQAAHIIGTKIYFETGGRLVRQPVEFSSIDRVYELVRSLVLKDPRTQINEYNPHVEIDMVDGTRVTMFIPPLSRQVSITFRRFVVDRYTLEDQAALGTIPAEAVPFFRALARTRPNTLIVGPVKSGKSTMLKTFYIEREHDQKVVCVEKHSELKLSECCPDRPLDELVATEAELLRLFPAILRTDFVYLIVGELRSVEAELSMQGCERGSTGLLCTYHTKHPHNIPGQLARLILDSFPNRRYEAELIRAADNIDIVVVMDQLPDKSKRVESVVELRLDPVTLQVSTHEIMRYDGQDKTWRYRFDLSDRLLAVLRKNDPRWAAELVKSLKALEQQSPIMGDNVVYAKETMVIRGVG
ncbi:type II secretion system protein E [Thermincola ferriacetica]|uniref:Type II secretion system protein E n=1 Tax=Thermincola ferriacetica TaxID=281456 RepID=A0A0L6W430_9FIRM|nr:ATPase, T2SS/T4P/T4SS family [Thermincola ferriacetica]KNZ70337.1 type II secretion system protein E [Thermincola ferriacetica]